MRKYIFIVFLICLLFITTSCKKNAVVTLNINDTTNTVEVKKGSTLMNDINPNIDGYEFNGWFLDSGFTQKFDINTQIKEDIELFAKMDKVFKVTMMIEGEEVVTNVYENTIINDLEVKEVVEKKFVGWYLDSELKRFAAVNTVIDKDLVLYAKYIDAVYTLSFETNGGYNIKSIKFNSGNIPEEPALNPSKLGYLFSHWSLDKEGLEIYDFTTPMKGDFTLYANYVETSYDDLLDSIVPDVIDSDIVLPEGYDFIEYNWDISDPSLLTLDGVYNPDLVNREIVITLSINVKGSEEAVVFDKNVTIKKYELKELVTGDIVMGYTSSWYYTKYSEEVLKTVDILYISFAYVNADGTLNLNSIGTMLRETVGVGHKNGIRVCLSIQGYGEDTKNFSDCAADTTLRKKLAKSMVDAVIEYRLDGIDIDWEYPGSYSGRGLTEDRANYTSLISEIRTQLDAVKEGYLLTSAIPAGPWGHERFELNKLVNYFDYINMMSYDLNSSNVGTHHTALYPSSSMSGTVGGCSVDETVTAWVNKGVPLSKICLGIAFYGKDIKTRTTSKDGLGQSSITGGAYKNSAFTKICDTYFSLIGSTVNYNFDYSSCAPYMFNTETRMFFTYDNELSIIYKCEYAKTKGLGGVMIWEIGEDNTNTLITAVAQGMDRKLDNKPLIVGGNETFNVGEEISLKVIKEVSDYALKDKYSYRLNDTTLASIDGNTLKLLKAGTLVVTAYNTETNVEYGTLTIVIK